MSARLIVGPPGSGRTSQLAALARRAAEAGRRVAWVTLPHQRAAVYARLVVDGPLLGLEVVTGQQLAYRLVAGARRLRPLVVGTERLVLVAEAIRDVAGRLPSPGEARLFAAAVAEAKRHALVAEDVRRLAGRVALAERADAAEAERLADVFEAYQQRLGERVDYDDVRVQALAVSREGPQAPGLDLIIVDGFRELIPLDLALWRSLGRRFEVHVSLPAAPAGWPADLTLPPAAAATRVAHAFVNPVEEARWVLRALGRDLERGYAERDLAVIAAPAAAAALRTLADEHGVPLVDEAPRSLAERPVGQRLLELLELPAHPTPTRLLAVAALAPLARLALERRVAGADAILALAREHGLADDWQAWRGALTPHGDLASWSRRVIDLAIQETERRHAGPAASVDDGARELLLSAAQAALRLTGSDGLVAWWTALLHDTRLAQRPPAGVALLSAERAGGRRFRRVYLVGASAGAFAAGEREDYFLPEDVRRPWDTLMSDALTPAPTSVARVAPGLPRRQRGRDAALMAELLTRGRELVVTAASGDRSGPQRLDPVLMAGVVPAPELPAGSALELEREAPYRPLDAPVPPAPGGIAVEALRRSDPCHFRVWAERLVGHEDVAPERSRQPAERLRRDLVRAGRLDTEARAALARAHPEAAAWLATNAAALARMRLGVRLASFRGGPVARLDGVDRDGPQVRLLRFTLPDEDGTASLDPMRRWNELIAARHLLRHPRALVERVSIETWPLFGEPRSLTERPLAWPRDQVRLDQVHERLQVRWRAWREAPTELVVGYHCRTCAVADVCRLGRAR